MKDNFQNLKPYEVVAEIINQMLRIDRAIKIEGYSVDVVEHYLNSTPDDKREIAFHVGRDVERDSATNAQLITRALQGIHSESRKTQKTSVLHLVELQESLIQSMVEPYKSQCLQILLARFGMLPMMIPAMGEMEDEELFAQFIEKVGGTLSTLGLMMENKVIGPEDLKHKPKILAELTDLKKVADELLATVHKNIPDSKMTVVK